VPLAANVIQQDAHHTAVPLAGQRTFPKASEAKAQKGCTSNNKKTLQLVRTPRLAAAAAAAGRSWAVTPATDGDHNSSL
jgi:hypothetical protein